MDIRAVGAIVLSKAKQRQLVSRAEPYILALRDSKTEGAAMHARDELVRLVADLPTFEGAFVMGLIHGASIIERLQYTGKL